MRILICNERFLFRYGHDRVLLLLAQGLKERGHEIHLMAHRLDPEVTVGLAHRVHEVPAFDEPYLQLDRHTARWLRDNWNSLFASHDEPDLALVGGWPFYEAIRVLRDHDVPRVYIDCGAVPLEGLEEGMKKIQLQLRQLRRQHLPEVSAAITNSKFTLESQTLVDAPELENAQAILLGADHLDASFWRAEDLRLSRDRANPPNATVRRARDRGHKVLLNLGRWEPGTYKRSEAIFKIARELVARCTPSFVLIVLEQPENVAVPEDLDGVILPIGFPDDAELAEIMRLAHCGISVSTWEGFNLPVAEMQWLGKPALALDLAAHPEVVCHPWCLARSDEEMVDKLAQLLTSGHPEPEAFAQSIEEFRDEFTWQKVQARYVHAIESISRSQEAQRPVILVDVSQACCDTANSGVMRVTRRLCRHLQAHAEIIFAVWDQEIGAYGLPYEPEYELIGSFNGPAVQDLRRSPWRQRVRLMDALAEQGTLPDWILLPEIIKEPRARKIRRWAQELDIRVAMIFYDSIAVLHPEYVPDTPVRENHASYMRGLAECDIVIPISHFSQACLENFWLDEGIAPTVIETVLLPDEFGLAPRRAEPWALDTSDRVEILCVSTLEPRKNHLALIEAVQRLDQLTPELGWRLTLVGNRYSEAESLALAVQAACHADDRIRWLGVVDDQTLCQLYSECTFTVYASCIEGFGMPIVESLWHGKPVLCHKGGVMRELALKGGCLMANVNDPEEFAAILARLATDVSLYKKLSTQAVQRPVRTWDSYANEVLTILSGPLDREDLISFPRRGGSSIQENQEQPIGSPTDGGLNDDLLTSEPESLKDSLLFPECPTASWEMEDSERLGLMALLHRCQPRVAIEVGRHRCGSLTAISQFAEAVYSISTEPIAQEELSHLHNVSVITGTSQDKLPGLMETLRASSKPVDFVLIDGDHSASGVKRDIEIVIGHPPIAPMIVAIHDSFNPDCRRGILEAAWHASKHVHWVEVDLIPGRVIEHGGYGTGELWGGFACALLSPVERKRPLAIEASAQRLFTMMAEQALSCAS